MNRAWLVEQRNRAVLETLDGSPVSQVVVRYGCRGSRCMRRRPGTPRPGWTGSGRSRGGADLAVAPGDGSRGAGVRPAAAHLRWGVRRIAFEVAQRKQRVLVRDATVAPRA